MNLLIKFKQSFDSKNISQQHFIATSALRDANNKNEIIEDLADNDIYLNIISGNEEAELLTNFQLNIVHMLLLT